MFIVGADGGIRDVKRSRGIGDGDKREGYRYIVFFKQKTAYDVLSGLVGSEVCIRDRHKAFADPPGPLGTPGSARLPLWDRHGMACLAENRPGAPHLGVFINPVFSLFTPSNGGFQNI